MVESQPGTVVAFDPSVTLSSFSAASRDRFMFNENQLVLAKLVRPLASYAAAYGSSFSYNTTTGAFTRPSLFENYRNSDGGFVFADDLFFLSDATGVPTVGVVGIVLGYDFQVSSSSIKFWSTTSIDTGNLSVDYSFDGITWTTVGTVTWGTTFDDTIELFEGQFPPQGQYVYTGTFTSVAGRYWRLKSQGITTLTVGYTSGATITVASTTGYPSSGSLLMVGATGTQTTAAYTGKTTTTFTGVSGGAASPAGSPIVGTGATLVDALLSNVTEVRVLQTTEPILDHWNSDGSQAVSVIVEGSQFYDICYDANDDVYYAIYFNDEPTQTDPIDPDDDFNEAFEGSSFSTTKWIESETYPYFVHNSVSGTLDMVSSAGGGLLAGNYGIDGSYSTRIELVGAFTATSGTAFSLSAEDFDTSNQYMVSAMVGSYAPPVNNARFGAAVMEYSSTIGSSAVLRNFHIRPEFFEFSAAGGFVDCEMAYSTAVNQYLVTVSGSVRPNATPGVPYVSNSFSFTIANVTTPPDGQGFSVRVWCASAAVPGTAASGIQIELERIGTNAYVRYKGTTGGTQTLLTHTIGEERHRPYIYGHPGVTDPNIRADNYTVTSGTIVFDTPVFTVVAIGKDGMRTAVSNVTDGDGYLIKNFDIIRNPQAGYNEFIYPYTSIATNGAAHGSGGEIYIKVGETLYKYTKAAGLPLTHEDEDAPNASVITVGEIPEDGITGFAYNGFSQAGLSYLKYEDSLAGVFLKTINTTDLTANTYKSKLDVASINFPFAWNVSDLSTLYFVSGTSLKLYDLNESKAAFVNVSSDKQVLAAGTAETATITAQVLNVYGIPKTAKTMTFSVSSGDGAISPAIGCSDGSGEDTTTYTVGSAVGTATITVSVSDTTCTP